MEVEVEKSWLEILNDSVCIKLKERAEHLLQFKASELECCDIDELHHIYETFKIISDMKQQ